MAAHSSVLPLKVEKKKNVIAEDVEALADLYLERALSLVTQNPVRTLCLKLLRTFGKEVRFNKNALHINLINGFLRTGRPADFSIVHHRMLVTVPSSIAFPSPKLPENNAAFSPDKINKKSF